MKTGPDWGDYNKAGAAGGPRPRLLLTLDRHCQTPGLAMDLGCGGGRDTLELLRRGWRVDAVDSDPTAIAALRGLEGGAGDRLTILPLAFEDLQPGPNRYDLITASYSLPFCHPDRFEDFWESLKRALRPGGVISCELFGENDEWNRAGSKRPMTFLSASRRERLTRGLDLLFFEDCEFDGPTFAGPRKRWHLLTVVGRIP